MGSPDGWEHALTAFCFQATGMSAYLWLFTR